MRYVLVISGKGGVGKTLSAINIARILAIKKGPIALIDADIANPNAAELLGVKNIIEVAANTFTPIKIRFENTGPPGSVASETDFIEFFSMATISGDKPVSMDASEYAQILRDVLQSSNWTASTAIIDMPAGVHNEFIELLTTFGKDLLGSIVVVQPAHVESAKKMLRLHQSEGVPVIGVIENMSHFECECGKRVNVFGDLDLEALCKEFNVTALGKIPLSMEIRNGVVAGKPFLSESLKTPILKAADLILEAKPVGEGFVEMLKQRIKQIALNILMEVMASVIEIANTDIPMKNIQSTYGFQGGRTIELDITDETLRRVKVQRFFRLENGVLKVVKDPSKIDDEIRVWDRAFLWCFLGERPDTGMKFDLMEAWLQGKVKYFSSESGTPRALQFMRSVWTEVRSSPSFGKLKPLIEKIA
jgi:ATP-binding protein involved in chromosome partitioning